MHYVNPWSEGQKPQSFFRSGQSFTTHDEATQIGRTGAERSFSSTSWRATSRPRSFSLIRRVYTEIDSSHFGYLIIQDYSNKTVSNQRLILGAVSTWSDSRSVAGIGPGTPESREVWCVSPVAGSLPLGSNCVLGSTVET